MKAKEKYKLIENRPGISPEQVRAGMDFQSLTRKISATENYFLKTAVLAAIIGASVITGYLLYKYFITPNHEPKNSTEPAKIQDTIYRSADTVEMILIDKPDSTKRNKAQAISHSEYERIISKPKPVIKKPDSTILQSVIVISTAADTIKSLNQGEVQPQNVHSDSTSIVTKRTSHIPVESSYTCILWNPDDPCIIPDSAKYELTINCRDCEFIYMSCNELEKKPGKLVWLNIPAKRGRIIMRKHFENITLYSDGKKIHPYAVANVVGDENNRYLSDRFKANYMAVTYQKKIILILVFPDAKVGDRIVIDETIDAVIQK